MVTNLSRVWIFSLFAISFTLYSCESIEDPSLKQIDNVEVVEMSKSLIHVTADMVIHNPNPFTLDLASADLTAYVDEIALADIDQSYDTSMPASGNFNMPVTIKFDLDKLYNEAPLAAIGKGLQILSKRQLKVKFLGNIKAGKGAAKVTVNIDQIEDVKF